MNDQNDGSGKIGLTSLLGLLFIALKLTHVINWSWWWVAAPFWAPWVIVLTILALDVFLFRRSGPHV